MINDDLADEIEAIRLAADFTSRRLLNEQKKEGGSSASSSRQRIRALLDKQKVQRVSEMIHKLYALSETIQLFRKTKKRHVRKRENHKISLNFSGCIDKKISLQINGKIGREMIIIKTNIDNCVLSQNLNSYIFI